MSEWIEVMREFGFPVVAFLLMYLMANTSIKKNTTAIDKLVDYLRSKK